MRSFFEEVLAWVAIVGIAIGGIGALLVMVAAPAIPIIAILLVVKLLFF